MNLIFDSKGIAMTEGVIVLPVFIIVWMGIFALYAGYTAKLEALGKAGNTAHAAALMGTCSDSAGDGGADVQTDASVFGADSKILGAIADYNPLMVKRVGAAAKETHEMFGRAHQSKGSRFMTCNIKPMDSVLDMVFVPIKESLNL